MKQENFEVFNCDEDNTFSEFQNFKAEQYVVTETIKPPLERIPISEIATENENVKENVKKDVLQEIDKLSNITNATNATNTVVNSSITTTVANTSTAILGGTVAVVSAVTVGAIPSLAIDVPKIQVDRNSIEEVASIDEINIKGLINNINSDYEYYVYFDQYENDNLLIEDEEINLEIIDTIFSFKASLYYGLTNYQYDIYYLNNDKKEIIYESDIIDYTTDQEYQATFDLVAPKNSNITFNDDGTYTFEINTNFKTNYPDLFNYQLDIINSDSTVLATYVGNSDIITLNTNTITDVSFKYYSIGNFKDKYIYNEKIINNDTSIIKSKLKATPDINNINIEGILLNPKTNVDYYIEFNEYNDDSIINTTSDILALDGNSFNIPVNINYGLTNYQYNIYYLNDDKKEIIYESDIIDYNPCNLAF